MADEFCLKMPDFHITFRDLLHAVNLHGTDGFTSPPKEGVLSFFALKNPTASVGLKPANLGIKGQHATYRPPKSLNSALLTEFCWQNKGLKVTDRHSNIQISKPWGLAYFTSFCTEGLSHYNPFHDQINLATLHLVAPHKAWMFIRWSCGYLYGGIFDKLGSLLLW